MGKTKRDEFKNRMKEIVNPMSEEELRETIVSNAGEDAKDLAQCAEEQAELIQELMKLSAGKGNKDDLLQEMAHVQWAIWRLQTMFSVTDGELYKAVQASVREPH